MRTHLAHIALGSNLGDRRALLDAAIEALSDSPDVIVERVSDAIETEAVTLPGAEAQGAYLNAAAALSTTKGPRELLDLMLDVERRLGRDRSVEARWGPRAIDLDLLLIGDEVIDEPGLVVPHPRLHERRFVLEPLAQIAPDAGHPTMERTIRELLAALPVSAR